MRSWVTIIAAMLSASLVATVLPGCEARHQDDQLCTVLMSIANDPARMKYIKKRIASLLDDDKFRESLRHPVTPHDNEERLRQFGGIDWNYLGIAEGVGSLEFHLDTNESGERDIHRIESAEIELGRSSIFVRLGSAVDMGLKWPPEHIAKLRPVGEDVFVYCDEGGD